MRADKAFHNPSLLVARNKFAVAHKVSRLCDVRKFEFKINLSAKKNNNTTYSQNKNHDENFFLNKFSGNNKKNTNE